MCQTRPSSEGYSSPFVLAKDRTGQNYNCESGWPPPQFFQHLLKWQRPEKCSIHKPNPDQKKTATTPTITWHSSEHFLTGHCCSASCCACCCACCCCAFWCCCCCCCTCSCSWWTFCSSSSWTCCCWNCCLWSCHPVIQEIFNGSPCHRNKNQQFHIQNLRIDSSTSQQMGDPVVIAVAVVRAYLVSLQPTLPAVAPAKNASGCATKGNRQCYSSSLQGHTTRLYIDWNVCLCGWAYLKICSLWVPHCDEQAYHHVPWKPPWSSMSFHILVTIVSKTTVLSVRCTSNLEVSLYQHTKPSSINFTKLQHCEGCGVSEVFPAAEKWKGARTSSGPGLFQTEHSNSNFTSN